MSRRATMPGADELFRRTGDSPETAAPAPSGPLDQPAPPPGLALAPGSEASSASTEPSPATSGAFSDEAVVEATRQTKPAARRRPRAGDRRPTGRERHEEKITVYVSPEELVDIEQAKLILRAQHGLAADRGRIVREAIAVVIADLEAKGEESILVRRLRGI
ncbi:MAG: hypothetical protein F2911_05835 [Actinobacteria bacterium]|nr:hypothetical protein [Actinomycetota bacterium]MSW35978.1 hypothetical protein [Actinomycetota bacterium]